MSKKAQHVTDSDSSHIHEMVRDIGQNQAILGELVKKIDHESKTNLDPIVQAKIKALRRSILVSDLKHQTQTIETIGNVLKEICSIPELPSV